MPDRVTFADLKATRTARARAVLRARAWAESVDDGHEFTRDGVRVLIRRTWVDPAHQDTVWMWIEAWDATTNEPLAIGNPHSFTNPPPFDPDPELTQMRTIQEAPEFRRTIREPLMRFAPKLMLEREVARRILSKVARA